MPEAVEETFDPRSALKTLVMLQGGQSIVVHGYAPTDLHEELEEARLTNAGSFYFLQDENAAPNKVCVDPAAVVALVRVD